MQPADFLFPAPGSGDRSPGAGIAAGIVGLHLLLGVLTLRPPGGMGLAELQYILWLPSGVALAAVLLFGVRILPWITLSALLTSLIGGGGWIFAIGSALGNTVEPAVAWSLLRGGDRFRPEMERVRDVLSLVLFGGILAPLAGMLLSVAALRFEGVPIAGGYGEIAAHWWLGHSLGILAFSPFLLILASRGAGTGRSFRSLEAISLLLAFLGITLLVLLHQTGRGAGSSPIDYALVPLTLWGAFRFGPKGAAAANILLTLFATWGAVAGFGPFGSGGGILDRLLLTGLLLAIVVVTLLLLGAVVVQGNRAEEARLRSENTYRMLVEQAADGIFTTDASGQILDVNSSGLEMVGYPRREILLKSVQDLFLAGEAEPLSDVVEALTRGRVIRSAWTLQRADGARLPVEVSAKRLEDGRMQGIVRDVSERKALEAQLFQSQKMEAVGMLAGGVAHDFNNLLTAIMGHAEFAEESIPETHPARADLVEIRRSSERAARLTRQLLAFARKQLVTPRVVQVDSVIGGMSTMLRRVLGSEIRLEIRTGAGETKVRVDPVQLEQVLLNLAINGREAMPDGGELLITTGVRTIEQDRWKPEFAGVPRATYLEIAVIDSGQGMDEETRARIFEPFFTTKDRSKGTGLGLATSYGIVRQAGGFIVSESALGSGSTFRILLPPTDRPLDMERESSAPPVEFTGSGETILLVEDEPAVLDLVEKTLAGKGFHVVSASSGEEGARIAGTLAELPFAILDIMLPGMSGKATAERIRAIHPGVRIVFISGYAETQVVHDGVVDEGIVFLPKPFSPETLAQTIAKVIAERSAVGATEPEAGAGTEE